MLSYNPAVAVPEHLIQRARTALSFGMTFREACEMLLEDPHVSHSDAGWAVEIAKVQIRRTGSLGRGRTLWGENPVDERLIQRAAQALNFGMTSREAREMLVEDRGASREDAFLAVEAAKILVR